jgi:hypothetical protein
MGKRERSTGMIYFQHIIAALAVQVACRMLTGSWRLGAAIASAYFIGRELAQAEYRWIEWFGHGLRKNMPWWGPFDMRVWTTLDQWVDWLGPLLATSTLAVAMTRFDQSRSSE